MPTITMASCVLSEAGWGQGTGVLAHHPSPHLEPASILHRGLGTPVFCTPCSQVPERWCSEPPTSGEAMDSGSLVPRLCPWLPDPQGGSSEEVNAMLGGRATDKVPIQPALGGLCPARCCSPSLAWPTPPESLSLP